MVSNISTAYLIVVVIIAAIVIAWILVRRTKVIPKDGVDRPARILDVGWQFYSKPTTLEPPGTVFRIDPDRKRYIVDILKVKMQKGEEVFGRSHESIEASVGILARFLGLKDVSFKAGSEKQEELIFEIIDPVREILTDAEIEKELKRFSENLEYRVDNRYFIIRESRAAKGIDYQLNEKQVDNLGGEASVANILSVEGTLFASKRKELFVLSQQFNKPMRVMFLPEEIKPISAGLGGENPELGMVPVKEVLMWKED